FHRRVERGEPSVLPSERSTPCWDCWNSEGIALGTHGRTREDFWKHGDGGGEGEGPTPPHHHHHHHLLLPTLLLLLLLFPLPHRPRPAAPTRSPSCSPPPLLLLLPPPPSPPPSLPR